MKTILAEGKNYKGFIQTSDIHIGESRNYEGYLERHRDVLWQILEHAEKKKLPLLIPGDLFHRNDTRHEERRLAYDWLCEMEARKIYAVVTAGNHDHIGGTVTQLDPLLKMPFKYVKIVGWEEEVIELGNIGIIALSWHDYTEAQIQEVVSRLYPLIEEKEYKIVMLHEFIYGSMMDNGKIITKGPKLPISLPNIHYWALGDIHKHQPGTLPNSWYAGSPCQFKFDDVREKGIIKVDLPFKGKPTFIKLRFKPFITVKSVEEMTEDAYYHMVADAETVLAATNDKRVVRADCIHEETFAIQDSGYQLTDGLMDLLASKGISQELQAFANSFVEGVAKRASA